MGLIIAAAITTGLAMAILAGTLLVIAAPGDRRVLAIAFMVALPLQPLAFYLLRLPIDGLVRAGFGLGAAWIVASQFYAPLTEEPAKWLVLAVPAVRRALSPRNAMPLALAIGFGFGIGEIWFLANALVRAPSTPDLPFWMFNGFMLERLEVCCLHAAFVALPIAGIARAKSFWPGAIAGLVLHFLTNFPIYLARIDFAGLGATRWMTALGAWVVVLTIAGIVMMWRLHRRLARVAASKVAVTPEPIART